jgi:tetratricopeptide (TPR) repeat protein
MLPIDHAFDAAVAHHKAGRFAQAEEIYRRIVAHDPRYARAWHLLGVIALETARHAEAIEAIRRAIATDPRRPEFHNDLGEAHRAAGQFDQALASYRRSIQINPKLSRPHINLGRTLRIKGEVAAAEREFRRAIDLDPASADAHHNLGCALLAQGDFQNGWPEYAWRTRLPGHPGAQKTAPRWDGSPLPGKRVELYCEQGFGDTLQFIRYLPLAASRAEVIAVVQPQVLPMLTSSGFKNLVPLGRALPPCDAQLALPDLPGLFGATPETVLADVPYLHAEPALVDEWRNELASLAGLKVGIAWQGNKKYHLDALRSVPLVAFEPLGRVPGVRLISLQVGDGADQIDSLAGRFEVARLERLDLDHGPFMDTAAVMRSLDLVVTSDTVTAHLAGALGVPVWVALCAAPSWRWMLARCDTPWYPTMRLFRQSRLGQWSEVFAAMAEAIQKEEYKVPRT